MRKSIEYLIEAKGKLNCETDYQLAKALKSSTANISNYMSGKTKMDDYHCIVVAQVLNIDPMEIIAAAQEEREKSEEKKEFWRDFRTAREREKGLVLVPMLIMILMIGTALLSLKFPEAVYIMSNNEYSSI